MQNFDFFLNNIIELFNENTYKYSNAVILLISLFGVIKIFFIILEKYNTSIEEIFKTILFEVGLKISFLIPFINFWFQKKDGFIYILYETFMNLGYELSNSKINSINDIFLNFLENVVLLFNELLNRGNPFWYATHLDKLAELPFLFGKLLIIIFVIGVSAIFTIKFIASYFIVTVEFFLLGLICPIFFAFDFFKVTKEIARKPIDIMITLSIRLSVTILIFVISLDSISKSNINLVDGSIFDIPKILEYLIIIILFSYFTKELPNIILTLISAEFNSAFGKATIAKEIGGKTEKVAKVTGQVAEAFGVAGAGQTGKIVGKIANDTLQTAAGNERNNSISNYYKEFGNNDKDVSDSFRSATEKEINKENK